MSLFVRGEIHRGTMMGRRASWESGLQRLGTSAVREVREVVRLLAFVWTLPGLLCQLPEAAIFGLNGCVEILGKLDR